jgi:acylphosphatase
MKHEIKKYTLSDMQYINKVLDAFCTKYTKHKCILKGKSGDFDLKGKRLSKKLIDYYKAEGIDVKIVENVGYHRKTEIEGMLVDIQAIAKNTKDYTKGIQVNIPCAGITKTDLDKDIERKEQKFIKYLTKNGIPLNRVCVESSLACVYKFGSMTCETEN